MYITYSYMSKEGERENNEDSVGAWMVGSDIALFVLADGLGGHGRGEEASALVTEQAIEIFRRRYRTKNCLERCFCLSQEVLLEKQKREHAANKLKTTLVLLKIVGDTVEWGHVGDSRLYHFKDGALAERTLDHSVPQMLVAAGEIDEAEIRHHPDRNRLLRVMGSEWERPQYQLRAPLSVHGGEAFLLCSDGFWENVTEAEMETCLRKAHDVRSWLCAMERIAARNGRGTHMDNYSAVAVFLREE